MSKKKLIPPVIKWSGSKRSQSIYLSSLSPEKYERYFEPFIGGGSMLPYHGTESYASDLMPELIDLWVLIQSSPNHVISEYRAMWDKLQNCRDYYYEIRDKFNKDRNPMDFLFLTRTCYNGLIRFNSKGEFNVSLHFGRPGIHPDRFSKIVNLWSQEHLTQVHFSCQDYRETLNHVKSGDFMFLDPPYAGTGSQYQSSAKNFNFPDFEDFLRNLNEMGVKWLLTLGESDDYRLPSRLYKHFTETQKGSSSFRRMKKGDNHVGDVVYANYELISIPVA